MKALILKDLLTMKLYSFGSVIAVVIAIIVSIVTHNQTIGYIPMLLFMMIVSSVTTITYDQYDNGYPFLFTLPFTKQEYVLSKYIVSVISILPILLIMLIYMLLSNLNPLIIILAFPVYLILISPYIPIYLYFGVEKSSIMMIVLTFLLIGTFFILFNVFGTLGLITYFVKMNKTVLTILTYVCACIIMGISYLISNTIMKNKEF